MKEELKTIDYRAPVLPSAMNGGFVDRNPLAADVPCGGCTLCCRTLIVPLSREEVDSGEYLWAWVTKRDGTRLGHALQRKPNGDCVYLGENGCTIHDRAPHVCKIFDCRSLFQKLDRVDRRRAIASGKLPKSLFDKGRQMLKDHGPGTR